MNHEAIREILAQRIKEYDAAKKARREGKIKLAALREIKHQYKIALLNYGHSINKQYPA